MDNLKDSYCLTFAEKVAADMIWGELDSIQEYLDGMGEVDLLAEKAFLDEYFYHHDNAIPFPESKVSYMEERLRKVVKLILYFRTLETGKEQVKGFEFASSFIAWRFEVNQQLLVVLGENVRIMDATLSMGVQESTLPVTDPTASYKSAMYNAAQAKSYFNADIAAETVINEQCKPW